MFPSVKWFYQHLIIRGQEEVCVSSAIRVRQVYYFTVLLSLVLLGKTTTYQLEIQTRSLTFQKQPDCFPAATQLKSEKWKQKLHKLRLITIFTVGLRHKIKLRHWGSWTPRQTDYSPCTFCFLPPPSPFRILGSMASISFTNRLNSLSLKLNAS